MEISGQPTQTRSMDGQRNRPPKPMPAAMATDFRSSLLAWFRAHGRKLPWRKIGLPYQVMVSEFMLQQTTVKAVVPYFQRWMKVFPDVATLASASEELVLKHWEGLGYYSRARNLHRAAIAIHQAGGTIPKQVRALWELPGIGPYTASAIAAFAFDEAVPVLDANILRVVARIFNYRQPIRSAAARHDIERLARSLLPTLGGFEFTSAIMDLGALVCRAGRPDCQNCPVRDFCNAIDPTTLPLKPLRQPVIEEVDCRSFAYRKGQVYLVRSQGPRWMGLWLLPPGKPSGRPLSTLPYSLTRHKIRLEIRPATPHPDWTSFPADDLPAMPTPHRVALGRILSKMADGFPDYQMSDFS